MERENHPEKEMARMADHLGTVKSDVNCSLECIQTIRRQLLCMLAQDPKSERRQAAKEIVIMGWNDQSQPVEQARARCDKQTQSMLSAQGIVPRDLIHAQHEIGSGQVLSDRV